MHFHLISKSHSHNNNNSKSPWNEWLQRKDEKHSFCCFFVFQKLKKKTTIFHFSFSPQFDWQAYKKAFTSSVAFTHHHAWQTRPLDIWDELYKSHLFPKDQTLMSCDLTLDCTTAATHHIISDGVLPGLLVLFLKRSELLCCFCNIWRSLLYITVFLWSRRRFLLPVNCGSPYTGSWQPRPSTTNKCCSWWPELNGTFER